ncbi:MAG: HAMP domain-containing sensor histidine kinase [FCB group bacterium]|jgi:two-component sensor histidine kinase
MKIFRLKIPEFQSLISLSKWQLKFILGTLAFIIFVSVLLYTQSIVDELIDREQKTTKLFADIYRRYSDPNSMEDYSFLIDKIAPTITFPVIFTDENDIPLPPYMAYTMNIPIDTTMSMEKQKEYLIKIVKKMKSSYQPIIVEAPDGKLLAKFYYTNSSLIDKLRFFPFTEIVIIATFIFIGYMAFSSIRRNEETKVWVGMAKEAAHQLGTPLSSMLAWIEILKNNKDNPGYIDELTGEMENDINRLNMIATRFSKIGSMPEKRRENLADVIENISQYFEKRLPHLGRQIEIVRDLDVDIFSDINLELFQWVIENLLKNAAEAIESKRGKVTINLQVHSKKSILISVTDTGKGMTGRQKRQIFYAGYTTKKRGWGLGLTLCKRIIEDYHNGKIFVKDSALGKGTTFWIVIPKPT